MSATGRKRGRPRKSTGSTTGTQPKKRGRLRKPRSTTRNPKRDKVSQYYHVDKTRINTPHVGLVNPTTDVDPEPTKYHYDMNFDPILDWSGKDEHDKLEIPTVSLHLHERIDSTTIIEKVMKKETYVQATLPGLFEQEMNHPSLDKAIQFYHHPNNWSNRLIAGDSLSVMNSLLKRENMEEKIQMIYIDPPYGVEYRSNFQPFVCKKEVQDRSDKHLAYTPETIKAFRDTWDLGIHSYLEYLRERLFLAKKLLKKSGSCTVQIADENLHYVRILMDEIFGKENFVSMIPFRKTTGSTGSSLPVVCDYLVWYAKDKKYLKYNKMYTKKQPPIRDPNYRYVELSNGIRRSMSKEEKNNPFLIPSGSKIYRHTSIMSEGKADKDDSFIFENEKFNPSANRHWAVSLEGLQKLADKNRLVKVGNNLEKIRYFDDFEYTEITNMWTDTTPGGFENKIYVVQTTAKTIQRFLLMTTDPGDLVLDPTCGSGTTAFVSEQYGRRWITCDTQRVAIALAKRRIMTAKFKYYKLAYPEQGVGAGFSFSPPNRAVEKITTKSLAYDEEPEKVILHDQPDEDKHRVRVSGPFTVEAVPSPTVMSIDSMYGKTNSTDSDRESTRQEEWRQTLQRSGIRTKNGKHIKFIDMSPHPVSRWIHAIGRTNDTKPKIVLISFGPPYAVLGPRQVESAIQEARKLAQQPDKMVFAAMQFDPEASRIIEELDWPGITTIKAQMNSDMLVDNLKKGEKNPDSFMLVGQPDASLQKSPDGKYTVKIRGFDYYDPVKDKIDSNDTSKIVMWMLDTDYDGRSIYPQQVFFPMSSGNNGGYWETIVNALKSYIDMVLIKAYTGTESLEFELGEYKKVAIKIIDDRGMESLKILEPAKEDE